MSNFPRRPFAVYLERQNLIMLALGFSSGLPFVLVGPTFGYWLADSNIALATIGYAAWIGLAYSFKFVWAPLIDRTCVPVIAKLGRRRSWMLLAQLTIGCGLAAMGIVSLGMGLGTLCALALLVAFASASQDIVIDAWRIESARNTEELGVLTSAYTVGYRVAMLMTEAVILPIAARMGWDHSYIVYAFLIVPGLAACLLAVEPVRLERASERKKLEAPLSTGRGLFDAVVGPFIVFLKAHGSAAIVMLFAIILFQLPNFLMGPMATPLYHHLEMSKDLVGGVRGTFGLGAVFAGVAAGGFAVVKLGRIPALLVGGTAQILGTMAYGLLPYHHDPVTFAVVMTADNFGIAFAGVTLVTYISSLTSPGYTATQYAWLSSSYTWVGKLLKGVTGLTVQTMAGHIGLMNAYAVFFIGAGLLGVPSLLLFLWLASQRRHRAA